MNKKGFTYAEQAFIKKCKKDDGRFTEKDRTKLFDEMVNLAMRFADHKLANKIAMALVRSCCLRTFDQLRAIDMKMVAKFDNIGPKSLQIIKQMKDYISQDDNFTDSLLTPGKRITWEEKYYELVALITRAHVLDNASKTLMKTIVEKIDGDFKFKPMG